jgi:hypothetical protein
LEADATAEDHRGLNFGLCDGCDSFVRLHHSVAPGQQLPRIRIESRLQPAGTPELSTDAGNHPRLAAILEPLCFVREQLAHVEPSARMDTRTTLLGMVALLTRNATEGLADLHDGDQVTDEPRTVRCPESAEGKRATLGECLYLVGMLQNSLDRLFGTRSMLPVDRLHEWAAQIEQQVKNGLHDVAEGLD